MIEGFPLLELVANRLSETATTLLAPVTNISQAALYLSYAAMGAVGVRFLEWAMPSKK